MIGKQELEHRTLGFLNFFALRGHHHAVGADNRAGGLQLRHLFNAHQAHATRSLQREIGVVTECRDIETVFAAHIDESRTFRHLKVLAVDRYFEKFS